MMISKVQHEEFRLAGLRGRGSSTRAASLLLLLRRWREKNARTALPAKGVAGRPTNSALESLAGGDLAARFHGWRGRSGRRYICSVFPVDRQEADGGLPEFADAVIIAVKVDAAGGRSVIGFCQGEHAAGAAARQAFVAASLAAGVQQWHVHLLTTDPEKRRAVIADIAALCQPSALEPV